jgi:cytidine deaminase
MFKSPEEYAFGQNCAEAEAIDKAFAQKKRTNLTGCFFISYNTKEGRYWGPCGSCSGWIRSFGGEGYVPNK